MFSSSYLLPNNRLASFINSFDNIDSMLWVAEAYSCSAVVFHSDDAWGVSGNSADRCRHDVALFVGKVHTAYSHHLRLLRDDVHAVCLPVDCGKFDCALCRTFGDVLALNVFIVVEQLRRHRFGSWLQQLDNNATIIAQVLWFLPVPTHSAVRFQTHGTSLPLLGTAKQHVVPGKEVFGQCLVAAVIGLKRDDGGA